MNLNLPLLNTLSQMFLDLQNFLKCFSIMHMKVDCIIKWSALFIRKKIPAGIFLFKVNNRNTRTRCEICSKLTINTPERRQWRRSGVFIVNFEHISHLVLVFLLLTLSR